MDSWEARCVPRSEVCPLATCCGAHGLPGGFQHSCFGAPRGDLRAPDHADHARTDHLLDPVWAQHAKDAVNLVVSPRDLDDDCIGCDVNHPSPEDVRKIADFQSI